MKNFDEARKARAIRPAKDRTFILGGETFIRRARVPAWVMERIDDIEAANGGQALAIVDELIDEMVEEPGAEKWASLRRRGRDEDPLTLPDVMDVLQWLIAEETRIPTSEPSPSGDGSETTGTGERSTGTAPSEESTQPSGAWDAFTQQPTPS